MHVPYQMSSSCVMKTWRKTWKRTLSILLLLVVGVILLALLLLVVLIVPLRTLRDVVARFLALVACFLLVVMSRSFIIP